MEVLQRTANRGSISTGYDIDNSLKLEQDNSEYLKANNTLANTTPTSSTTGTFSCWVKRTELGTNYLISSSNSARYSRMFFNSSDQIQLYSGDSSWNSVQPITNAVFRDTSAWYHIVLRLDSTDSTAANRLRLYINGEEQTWSTAPNITQNGEITFAAIGGPTWHGYGAEYTYFTPSNFFSGYLAEAQYIDGQALAPTEFGETDSSSGIWKPKEYDGTYGNAGYYLDFEDASNLGNDVSGNGFDFDENNITSADQATDTPTNNFCTWNPLWVYASQPVISEGATKVRYSDSTNEGAKATIGLTNGKWYWEAKPVGTIGSQYIGIQTDGDSNIASNANSLLNNYTMVINPTGRYYSYAGSLSESADQGFSFTTSDWLGIALDMDSSTQTIKYYKNNSLFLTRDLISDMQGSTVFPFLMNYENRSWDINFGGYTINTISSSANDGEYGTFEYAPPSGYYALCSKNLAEYG